MEVFLEGKTVHLKTVWLEGKKVKMINQPLLPHRLEIVSYADFRQVAEAIKTMVVRGAPAIGASAAYGMALAAAQAPREGFAGFIEKAAEALKATRPTAQDLFNATNLIQDEIKKFDSAEEAGKAAVEAAQNYAEESIQACQRIGEFGEALIEDGARILTHCNAGWLACVDWGTALSPIYQAKRKGKKNFIFVDETRPRSQGARLTAWELGQEKISHAIIADNAAGYFMQKGEVDLVIVGADRVAANGDIANKIGTYEKAVLAHENSIPFYVAAPLSTFDLGCSSGKEIPIEERNEDEVLFMFGLNEKNEIGRVRISPKESKARNPAFDVTPAKYITGIITEKGIVKPNAGEISSLGNV